MAVLTRTELDSLIRERLAADPDFRKNLKENPRATVQGLISIPLPEAVTIEVHEETLAHLHLVIPAAGTGGELTDDALELVAGGTDICWGNCAPQLP